MALPKPIRPEYNTSIPSTGKKIKYQPFSVKEEKILVLAAESQEPDEITNAITNVLERCVTSPVDFKVSDLALFDIEYLFLKARSKSAGEKITVNVTDPDDETCKIEHEINIDKIQVQKNKDHVDVIQVSDTVSVKMKYPDISFFSEGVNTNTIGATTELVARCVSQLVIDDETYAKSDMSDDELMEWLDGLTTEQFAKLGDFFATMPKLSHSFTLKNNNTDKDFTIVLEGLADFF